MPTLYRQYRPQTFSEIVGQDHVTETLRQAIVQERLAHAYLFYGSRGTGKTTTARVMAKAVNCEKAKKGEPCGTCSSCTGIAEGKYIDLIEIDAASNRGIDDIRALRDGVGLSPGSGRYKVYIIDEVHMLTREAFAALLKTLEEPVPHAIFILATTDLHKVPETILSRCQVFRFKRATVDEMRGRLTELLKKEKRKASDESIDFIISRSDGCYRDAESLLGQMLTVQDGEVNVNAITDFLGLPPQETIHDFLQATVLEDPHKAMDVLDRVFEEGFDPEQFALEAIREARDAAVLLAQGGKDGLPAFAQEAQALSRLPVIIRALLQAVQDLAYVPEPHIALQLAALTVCKAPDAPRPASTQPAREVKESPKTVPVKKAEVKPELKAQKSTPVSPGVVEVSAVEQKWPELVSVIKSKNPVASTFLRATHPIDMDGSTVVMRVQYALHRNFFEKPENKKMVEEELSKLAGVDLEIRCRMDDISTTSGMSVQQKIQSEEESLYETAKEVFSS